MKEVYILIGIYAFLTFSLITFWLIRKLINFIKLKRSERKNKQ